MKRLLLPLGAWLLACTNPTSTDPATAGILAPTAGAAGQGAAGASGASGSAGAAAGVAGNIAGASGAAAGAPAGGASGAAGQGAAGVGSTAGAGAGGSMAGSAGTSGGGAGAGGGGGGGAGAGGGSGVGAGGGAGGAGAAGGGAGGGGGGGSGGALDCEGAGQAGSGTAGPCCAKSDEPGCSGIPPSLQTEEQKAIEACVCAQDLFCCNNWWDATCTAEVGKFGCGSPCPTEAGGGGGGGGGDDEACEPLRTRLRVADLRQAESQQVCIRTAQGLSSILKYQVLDPPPAFKKQGFFSDPSEDLEPGEYTVWMKQAFVACADGPQKPEDALTVSLAKGDKVWVVFLEGGMIRTFSAKPQPPGERWYRVIHGNTADGPLDLGLVPSGESVGCPASGQALLPLWTGMTFGSAAEPGQNAVGAVDDDGYLRLSGELSGIDVGAVGLTQGGTTGPLLEPRCERMFEGSEQTRAATCFLTPQIQEPGAQPSPWFHCCNEFTGSCWAGKGTF